MDYGFVGGWCIGVSIGQWLGFVLETLPDTLRCSVNVRQECFQISAQTTSEIDSMNESTQDGSAYSYLGKAIAGWARHVSKVRGKETAGSKNRNSKNRQFFEGIRKYRIYISLRGRRNVWTGK